MRLRLAHAVSMVAAAGAVLAAVACGDLFHSTGDFENACDFDADNPGCNSICLTDSARARDLAEHACAWLGACALPVGDNQFGSCVFAGILAYDCNANPNRTVQGSARAFWSCMTDVTACSDVSRCLGDETCAASSTSFSSCGRAQPNLLLACPSAHLAEYENCAAFGQTCTSTGPNTASCSGDVQPGPACTGVASCAGDGGTTLVQCADGGALSVDCKSYGGGACVASAGGFAACKGDHGSSCTPTAEVQCTGDGGNVARGCPGGVLEAVDCSLLTGPGTCHKGLASPALGVAAACGSAACSPDSCSGTMLTSCSHGQQFTFDCSSLGQCTTTSVVGDGGPAACGKL